MSAVFKMSQTPASYPHTMGKKEFILSKLVDSSIGGEVIPRTASLAVSLQTEFQSDQRGLWLEGIVVEYPSPSCKDLQVLQHLRQTVEDLPVIFSTTGVVGESIAELTARGVFDSVEQEHIARLPMTVRRALNDKKLREELEEARKALKHSQSLYRALVDNPAYGICRCNAEGELLDVNQTLVTMLGYTSKEQVLAANQGSEIIPNPCTASPFVGRAPEATRIEPVEIGWKRKNGTTLKAR